MMTWQLHPLKLVVHSCEFWSVQNRPLQQALAVVQAWPMRRHPPVLGWQVPEVEPAPSTQVNGGLLQQSALELQVAPCGWHGGGGPQWLAVQ